VNTLKCSLTVALELNDYCKPVLLYLLLSVKLSVTWPFTMLICCNCTIYNYLKGPIFLKNYLNLWYLIPLALANHWSTLTKITTQVTFFDPVKTTRNSKTKEKDDHVFFNILFLISHLNNSCICSLFIVFLVNCFWHFFLLERYHYDTM